MLDGNARQNLATFCQTWMEPNIHAIMDECVDKNMIDKDEYTGKYLFKFHPAILFGCCAGARTTTAALGMVNEQAQSTIPGLGYTVTYAVGNTFLTIWGLVIIVIMS